MRQNIINGHTNQPIVIRQDKKEIEELQKEIDSKQQILTIDEIPVDTIITANVTPEGSQTSVSCLQIHVANDQEENNYFIPDIYGLQSAIDNISSNIFYAVPYEFPPSSGEYMYMISDNGTTQSGHTYTASQIAELFNTPNAIKVYCGELHDGSQSTKKIMMNCVQVVDDTDTPICYFTGWLGSDEKQVIGTLQDLQLSIEIIEPSSGSGNVVESVRWNPGSSWYQISHSFNQLKTMLLEGKTVVLPVDDEQVRGIYQQTLRVVYFDNYLNQYYAVFVDPNEEAQSSFIAVSPDEVMHTEGASS